MSAPKELDVILSKSSKGYHVRWKDGTYDIFQVVCVHVVRICDPDVYTCMRVCTGTEATMKRVEMTSWEGEVLKFETELSERKRMTKKRQERLDAKKKLAEIAEARAAEERTRTATHVAVEDYEPFDDQGTPTHDHASVACALDCTRGEPLTWFCYTSIAWHDA